MQFASDEAKSRFEKGLAKNQDPYGLAVYRFASEWATRMEAVIPEDAPLETVAGLIRKHAKKLSHEADDEGITGFMYGCAVSMLSDVWVHGEQLRRWHNIDTQIGTEGAAANESGGVLNPALLNVG